MINTQPNQLGLTESSSDSHIPLTTTIPNYSSVTKIPMAISQEHIHLKMWRRKNNVKNTIVLTNKISKLNLTAIFKLNLFSKTNNSEKRILKQNDLKKVPNKNQSQAGPKIVPPQKRWLVIDISSYCWVWYQIQLGFRQNVRLIYRQNPKFLFCQMSSSLDEREANPGVLHQRK